jgi:hypothetical protein
LVLETNKTLLKYSLEFEAQMFQYAPEAQFPSAANGTTDAK